MRGLRRSLAWLSATTLIALAAAQAASGCGGGSSSDGPPPPLPTGTGHPLPVEAGPDASSPPADAAAAPDAEAGGVALRWVGTLAASAPTDFGGPPYCKYRITLKQIEVDVTLNAAGLASAASVKNIAFEEAPPPCPNAPMSPTNEQYSIATSTKLASGALHIDLLGFAQNRPATTLSLEGTFALGPTRVVAQWHRTDQGPPLDWRVTATVSLDRR